MATTDRMKYQINTAQAIIYEKSDYLLNAKNNQPALKTDFEQYVQDKTVQNSMGSYTHEEGKKDARTAYVSSDNR